MYREGAATRAEKAPLPFVPTLALWQKCMYTEEKGNVQTNTLSFATVFNQA